MLLLLQRLANLPDSGPNNQKAKRSMRPANTKSKLANYMLDKFGDGITCTDSGTVLVLDGDMPIAASCYTRYRILGKKALPFAIFQSIMYSMSLINLAATILDILWLCSMVTSLPLKTMNTDIGHRYNL